MINKTRDYDKFKTIRGNRIIHQGHLNKLILSIKKKNMLNVNPIIVNERMEVIDGQHRLLAAEKLELPIYYTEVEGARLTEVQDLNVNSKNWSLKDWIDSYIQRGKKDYALLKDFAEAYEISPTIAATLLSTANVSTGGGVAKTIKNGTFKATTTAEAGRFAKFYTKVRDIIDKGTSRRREFMSALVEVWKLPEFEEEIMIRKLELFGAKLLPWAKKEDYMRSLEEIYNFKSKQDYVRFF